MKWTFSKNKRRKTDFKSKKNDLYFYPNLWGK